MKFDEARQTTAMPDALTLWVSRHIPLIRAADHIVQTAGRGRVDIAAGGNHYISAVHCGFVAAAVECFA